MMRKKEAGLTKGLMKRLILTSLCVLIVTGTSFGDWVTPKWVQLPNETSYGMDVRMDRNDGVERTLADDFLCASTDKITDIHFWGSWKGDVEGVIKNIHLSIHEDISASQSQSYSRPGEQLWAMDFGSGQFAKQLYKDISPSYERWLDPINQQSYQREGDQKIWQYNINIDPSLAFEQQGTAEEPRVYWLDVYVETNGGGEFGWKTSSQHWNDDAVWGVPNPTGQPGISWSELGYPYSTPPWQGSSVDFAFVVTPEPGTILLLGTGLLTVISRRRRFNNMAQRRRTCVFGETSNEAGNFKGSER